MSEAFYEKFLSFFFCFFKLLLLIFGATALVLFYFSTQNLIFYYGYCAVLIFVLIYGTKYYRDFRDFKESLYLFFPSESEKPLEPLNMEVNDLPLKICILYRNGASLNDIKRNFGFSHSTQVRRELLKGLDILLKSYEKHNGNMSLV